MIGDSYEADVGGALRAGIKAILVRKPNLKEYKWYSKSLENIAPLIEEVLK
jgi:putative hydrolase of the HAD superfamily